MKMLCSFKMLDCYPLHSVTFQKTRILKDFYPLVYKFIGQFLKVMSLFFSLFVSVCVCLYMLLPAWSSALLNNYKYRCVSIFQINAFYIDDCVCVCVCILGNLNSGDEVLEWLRKNRFRQPELNVFMYAVIALAITFVMYSVWLLSCFRPHTKQAWLGNLSWEMEDLHTLGWVVQWQATISAQGYPMWSLSCKKFYLYDIE